MAGNERIVEGMDLSRPLPVGSAGTRASGWWGVWTLIVTESALFGYLLFSYFYLKAQTVQDWPPQGPPELAMPGVATVLLLSSSLFVWGCEKFLRARRLGWSCASMAVAILFGAVFVGIQMYEYAHKGFTPATDLYGSLYFVITGFHMAHVVIGLFILSFLLLWVRLGYFDERRYAALQIGGLYWHFVDAVWIFIFSSLYLSPYVLR